MVRSIVKATEFRKVVIAIEKSIGFAVKEVCLARYGKNPSFLTFIFPSRLLCLKARRIDSNLT